MPEDRFIGKVYGPALGCIQKDQAFLLTTFALCRGVQVKDHIQGLSQLQGRGFALPVLTHRSDVHRLGKKTAVEELLRLQEDSEASLLVQEGDERERISKRWCGYKHKFKG